jgi:hypothetical protein
MIDGLLKNHQIFVFFILKISVGSIQGHDFMLFMKTVLIHASHTKGLSFTDAVKSDDVVVLKTPLQRLRVEHGRLKLNGSLDFLCKSFNQVREIGNIEVL